MSILRDFERRLEGLVEGFFAKAFRSGLQPVELGKRALREMEAGHTTGVRNVWAPNRYTFRISPDDHERFAQAEKALAAELRQLVRDGAAEREWELVGPADVVFEVDDTLGRGQFRCEAALVEGPDRPMTGEMQRVARENEGRAADAAAGDTGLLYLIENGSPTKSFVLDKDVVTIGRTGECDVVLADPGASRHHAEVRRTADGYVVVDVGSTNGTMVNQTTVSEHTLQQGDRITIGNTVLEFRTS
ncbi:MAG: FhaA domain-containing protein [Actinomycetota bacterium]|nr:DUF3662 and FHA domain-containing protein [Actinomycetota bacterium]